MTIVTWERIRWDVHSPSYFEKQGNQAWKQEMKAVLLQMMAEKIETKQWLWLCVVTRVEFYYFVFFSRGYVLVCVLRMSKVVNVESCIYRIRICESRRKQNYVQLFIIVEKFIQMFDVGLLFYFVYIFWNRLRLADLFRRKNIYFYHSPKKILKIK